MVQPGGEKKSSALLATENQQHLSETDGPIYLNSTAARIGRVS